MGMVIVIAITGCISAFLSLMAKLTYDGIKAKRNGNGNGKLPNGQISVDLALLSKDLALNNDKLVGIARSTDRLVELSIAANVHLTDLKTVTAAQTSSFRNLISSLTATIAKLESNL